MECLSLGFLLHCNIRFGREADIEVLNSIYQDSSNDSRDFDKRIHKAHDALRLVGSIFEAVRLLFHDKLNREGGPCKQEQAIQELRPLCLEYHPKRRNAVSLLTLNQLDIQA